MRAIRSIVMVATLSLATLAWGHGNNPKTWVAFSLGGVDLVVEADVYDILEMLAPNMVDTPAGDCIDALNRVCGVKKVCCICFDPCSDSCQDADGGCQPCAACGGNKSGEDDLDPDQDNDGS